MDENEITSIRCSKKTKERFDQLGNVSMTADDVLNNLIEFWNKYKDVVKSP